MEDIEVEELAGTETRAQNNSHPRENSKNSYHIYDANAAAFVDAVKNGSLACLDASAAVDGKVLLEPPAVYDYETGRVMKGINGMLVQDFAAGKKAWGRDENGNIPVTTPSAAGKDNYDWNSHFSLTTVSKEGGEYVKRLYNVIPLSAVKDKDSMNLKAPLYQTRRGSRNPHRDIICNASGCSPVEFFAQYAAATKIGATFATDSDTISRVKDETLQHFSASTWKDRDGKDTGRVMSGSVYSFGTEFEKRADEILSSMFDRKKAPERNSERTFQQNKERAAAALSY